MFNTIEIYKEKLNSYSEIRIILFYRTSINEIDTTILPYPTLSFEHPKLIKPFLKEKNLLKRLEKKLNEYSPQQATGYLPKAMLLLLLKFQI